MTTQLLGEHHVTIPDHRPLPPGTLKSILRDVVRHFDCSAEAVLARLLG